MCVVGFRIRVRTASPTAKRAGHGSGRDAGLPRKSMGLTWTAASTRGSTWLDAQVMTDHMRVLGAKEIDRGEFLDKLEDTQEERLKIF